MSLSRWLLLVTPLAVLGGCTPAFVGAPPGAGPPSDTGTSAPDTGPRPDGDTGDGAPYDGSSGGHGGDDEGEDCEDEPVAEGDPLAALGACGHLVYAPYRPRGRDEALDTLPDFSFAGFERGGVALPEVATVLTVSPGSGDDSARIQDAIDEVSARSPDADGFRGAVLLTAGTYRCRETLRIEASGVVLRGTGQGEDGTVIVATDDEQYPLIEIVGERGPARIGDEVDITDAYVPVGAASFTVADAGGFSVGVSVAVVRTPNDAWVEELGMDAYGWDAGSYEIEHERTVAAIDGDRITVDIPLVDSLAREHGGGALVLLDAGARVHHVGVEDLRLDSEYDGEEDEEHGWTGVLLQDAEDCWVQRITVEHVGSEAVSVTGSSRFITVQDAAMLDPVSPITGGNRYLFEVDSGLGVLFQRCYARDGRHSFVSGSRVTGPNVWLDSLAEDAHADDGPHHRWATGLLFDNIRTTQLRVQNRADSGSGHGWAGAQVLFWNGEVSEEFVSDAPPGSMNWVVGVVGPEGDGQWVPEEPPGLQESLGEPALPRSLYLQQLADRLGEGAVAQITTEAQRAGTLWEELADWAGEGTPRSTP
ncbi:MAG: hypothetical protein ABIO70_27315 [Pseudomonadota bacterium]